MQPNSPEPKTNCQCPRTQGPPSPEEGRRCADAAIAGWILGPSIVGIMLALETASKLFPNFQFQLTDEQVGLYLVAVISGMFLYIFYPSLRQTARRIKQSIFRTTAK